MVLVDQDTDYVEDASVLLEQPETMASRRHGVDWRDQAATMSMRDGEGIARRGWRECVVRAFS
ncbi:MAG: hypothetical protein D6791_18210 [Chloroflexi bacterium]|nr:MAG: hypothetical protein D6791_18210 [Chloroflexota bacterium]